LPLNAAIPFGYTLFYKFAFLKWILYLTLPITLIEKSLPFGNLILFIILFAGIVRNSNIPYFVRFNGCQALLLDISLIIFSYLLRIFQFTELGIFLFISVLAVFIYSVIECIYGVEPEIPFISKSVRMQIY
tara:strand:- start:117 stop:509 length:393 start_codon:yes stop_codon:yes gene_type:complete